MIYDGKLEHDARRAIEKLNYFLKNKKRFELTEKKENRTLKQNSYLHLILSWYAIEYGETLEYVKQEVFKKVVNPNIFKTEFANWRTGEIRTDWKSTSDLDTGELSLAIDRFRDYASKEFGLYLPEPKDMIYLQEIEKQIQIHKQYL